MNMVVTKDQFVNGVINFVDCEIGKKVSGLKKFEIYFMLPSLNKIISDKISVFVARPELSEFFDETGNIRLDIVANRAKEAMQKTIRLDIPVIAITLEEADVDVIKSYIQKA